MSRRKLLEQLHWHRFRRHPGLGALSTPVLYAADDFFLFLAQHGLAAPTPADLVHWSLTEPSRAPGERLDFLLQAMTVCIPSLVPVVAAAQALQPRRTAAQARPETPGEALRQLDDLPGSDATEAGPWDPIVRPSRKPPVARHVSLQPDMLPPAWQASLRRMAQGLPQNGVVVAMAIVIRMREKLCQLAWSAQQAGLPLEISEATVDRYQADLTARREAGRNGLRWATLRASIEELHRFARYTGMQPGMQRFLADRRDLLDRREQGQKALKHFALARTGNTTNRVLDMADALLAGVDAVLCPKKRHRMRNGACIMGLFPIAPLRPASADLIFGTTLFWRNGEWVIDTAIQKTQSHNPEPFVMPLHADHGKFINAIIIGDSSPQLLPQLRQNAIARNRQLFVLHDGKQTAKSYIPRIYKVLTGNSLTTSRTMLHSDLAISEGIAGTYQAMTACHQTAERTAALYKQDTVAIHAVLHRQAASRLRRSAHADTDGAPSLGFLAD